MVPAVFTWRKVEYAINGLVDWMLTLDPAQARAFRENRFLNWL